MAEAFSAAMPANLDLGGNYTLRLTAIDPVTGNIVSGITVSNLAIYVSDVGSDQVTDLGFGDFLLVPGPGA